MNGTKYAVIGGDNRYKILKELLEKDGCIVSAYGNMHIGCEESLEKCIMGADAVILPIPVSKDGESINMCGEMNITFDELFDAMQEQGARFLMGGVIPEKLKQRAQERGIRAEDIFDREEVAINNAVPTAEGAIMTAIQESDRVLFKSRVLVMGFGRCGKVLSAMLRGMGADVSVTFRKKSDEAYINASGCSGVDIKELGAVLNDYDFIFNTIPALMLDGEKLGKVNGNAVIIDIAQAPGGVDYAYASKLNIKVLYCPGLPGRVAPYTAAQILKTAITDIVQNNT